MRLMPSLWRPFPAGILTAEFPARLKPNINPFETRLGQPPGHIGHTGHAVRLIAEDLAHPADT